MEKIAIFTDGCSDIPNIQSTRDIKVLPLYYYFNNDDVEYGDKITIPMNVFFNKIQNGGIPRTAAVNVDKAEHLFEEEIKKGNDIICVSMSSELSASYSNAYIAGTILKDKYPNAKITVIDSLTGALGEGFLAMKALKMRNEGNTYEEIINYIETYRKYYNVEFFVDDLSYLERGGRISKTAAIAGKILSIKPILYVDELGKVGVAEKVMGTKKVFSTLQERLASRIDTDIDYIGIVHANCIENARKLEDIIKPLGLTDNYIISEIGPIIASHVGPGACGLVYKRNIRLNNKSSN